MFCKEDFWATFRSVWVDALRQTHHPSLHCIAILNSAL
jgi:hypothetical protein